MKKTENKQKKAGMAPFKQKIANLLTLLASSQVIREEFEAGLETFQNSSQCDQIGQFLKVLGYKISNKSGPTIWQFFRLP